MPRKHIGFEQKSEIRWVKVGTDIVAVNTRIVKEAMEKALSDRSSFQNEG